jgi:ATP-dependent Clp protease protease subunit
MVINPYVIDGQGKISDIFSRNLEQNVIYLVGEINDEQAAVITAQMLHLANVGKGDIQLYINSPGGSVAAGLSIYDTMQHIHNDVSTICLGQAASMAAVLLSGGTKGKRYILPHGEVMIHQPSGGMEGQAADMCIAAEHIKRIRAGLRSRISATISFSAYSPEDMLAIVHRQAGNMGLQLEEKADPCILEYFKERTRDSNFGNGREGRSFLENCMVSVAGRTMKLSVSEQTMKCMTTILEEDVKDSIKRMREGLNAQICQTGQYGFLQGEN